MPSASCISLLPYFFPGHNLIWLEELLGVYTCFSELKLFIHGKCPLSSGFNCFSPPIPPELGQASRAVPVSPALLSTRQQICAVLELNFSKK